MGISIVKFRRMILNTVKRRIKHIRKWFRNESTEKETWQIAIRNREEVPLYRGNGAHFRLVPNSLRYWRADPFPVERDGETWLFCEEYDRFKEKGILAAARMKDGKLGKFRKCLELPVHLSYPCVFCRGEELWMVPESRKGKEIGLYKCTKFPYMWTKEDVLLPVMGVDTTPVPFDLCNSSGLYVTTINDGEHHNDSLFIIDSETGEYTQVRRGDTKARCGGHFIADGEGFLRPAQDDGEWYGRRLIFYRVKHLERNDLQEEEYITVIPPGDQKKENEVLVEIDKKNRAALYCGVHTYNCSEKYEVIDLVMHNSRSVRVFAANIFRKMYRKNE